jgi:hypothetical protein
LTVVTKQQGSVGAISELRDRTAVSVKRGEDSKQNKDDIYRLDL